MFAENAVTSVSSYEIHNENSVVQGGAKVSMCDAGPLFFVITALVGFTQEVGRLLARIAKGDMDQVIEITLVGMNEIAREGLKRILLSENFQVRSLNVEALEPIILEMQIPIKGHHSIFVIESGICDLGGELLEICEKVQRFAPHARIAVLAESFDYEDVARAFNWGVDGYILKSISCEPLFGLLRLIALGEKALPSQLAANLCRASAIPINDDWNTSIKAVTLSQREAEVLICLSRGMANKLISRQHKITEATVKIHVKAILRKLKVSNRTQAAIWAVQHGIDASLTMNGDPEDLGAVETGDHPQQSGLVLVPSGLEDFAPDRM